MDNFEERVRALYLDPNWDEDSEVAKRHHRQTMAAATISIGGRFDEYLKVRGGLPAAHREMFEQAHEQVLRLLAPSEGDLVLPSLTWIPNDPARLSIHRGGSALTVLVSDVFVTNLKDFTLGWRRWHSGDQGPCGKHPPSERVEAMTTVALSVGVDVAYLAFATHERCRECRHLLNMDRTAATEIEKPEEATVIAASAFALLHEIAHAVRGDLAAAPEERKSHDEIAADLWAIDRMPEVAESEVWPGAVASVLLLAAAAEALGGTQQEPPGIAHRRFNAGLARIAEIVADSPEPAAAQRCLTEVVEAGRLLNAAVDPRALVLQMAV